MNEVLQDLSLRDFVAADVDFVLDYWYRSPAGFIESLGGDRSQFPEEEGMRKFLLDRNRAEKKPTLMIALRGNPIGMYTINCILENESALFHAHIWSAKHRGQGIGTATYPWACEIFFGRFNFKKIIFKTPAHNVAANRIKKKVGIREVGKETLRGYSMTKNGTRAIVYEVHRHEIKSLIRESGGRVEF